MFLKYIHQATNLKTLFITLIHNSYWIWRTVKIILLWLQLW